MKKSWHQVTPCVFIIPVSHSYSDLMFEFLISNRREKRIFSSLPLEPSNACPIFISHRLRDGSFSVRWRATVDQKRANMVTFLVSCSTRYVGSHLGVGGVAIANYFHHQSNICHKWRDSKKLFADDVIVIFALIMTLASAIIWQNLCEKDVYDDDNLWWPSTSRADLCQRQQELSQ